MNFIVGLFAACSAIRQSFVETVGKLKVFPAFLFNGCCDPVSPSLKRVPWVLVPRSLGLVGQTIGTMLHYDCRHPILHRFTCRWRCSTWLSPCVLCSDLAVGRSRLAVERKTLVQRQDSWSPGTPFLPGCSFPQENDGSPKFPSYPCDDMPPSTTPVVSLSHRLSAFETVAFRSHHSVSFGQPLLRIGYPIDHNNKYFEARSRGLSSCSL